MKALIYCRVSSERQVAEGHGLDSQEHRCREFAKQKSLTITTVFKDEGISGAVFNRPGIARLFEHISKHPFEKFVVIVDDLSRIARDVRVHATIREQLRKMEADLLCPNFNFEDTPEGELGENLIASVNQYNRDANARQVAQKMRARAESGHWPLGFPAGLKNIDHPEHGRFLVPDEPIASVIKAAIEGYRDRILLTQEDIVSFITEQYALKDIKRTISLHGVQGILKNILYAGYIEYPKWDISRRKAVHEGIISIETYDEVQNIMDERTKPKTRKDTSVEFPLRGLIICSNCLKPITASFNTSRNGQRYPNYFCKTKGCPLQNKVTNREKLEKAFLDLLEQRKLDSEEQQLALEILTDAWQQLQTKEHEAQQAQKLSMRDLDSKIETIKGLLHRARQNELIEAYEQDLLTLLKKKEQTPITNYQEKYTSEQFGTAAKKVIEVLEEPVVMWKNGDLNDKLTVFYMHFDQKPAYNRISGFGTAPLAQSVELIRSLGSEKVHSVEMPGNEPGSEGIHQKLLQA